MNIHMFVVLALQAVLLPIGYFLLSRSVWQIKEGWVGNDRKKVNNGIGSLMTGIVLVGMFLIMFGRRMLR